MRAPRWSDGSYGNGPYRSIDCKKPREAVESLRQLVGELASLATKETVARIESVEKNGEASAVVVLDWSPYEEQHQKADAAIEAGDLKQAVSHYSELIRGVMQSVRDDDTTKRFRLPSSTSESSDPV